MQQNVLVVVFNTESEGYQAITELKKENHGADWIVTEAALVKKEAGSIKELDVMDTGLHTSDDAFRGGLIGGCLGILGGPIGVLLGGSYGALVGMGLDTIDSINVESMLEQIAQKLDEGMEAIVALTEEATNEALDANFGRFDTIIARFDAAVVAQEVDRAREMEAEMQRLARMELRKQRNDDFKAKVEEKRANIKESFEKKKAEREDGEA